MWPRLRRGLRGPLWATLLGVARAAAAAESAPALPPLVPATLPPADPLVPRLLAGPEDFVRINGGARTDPSVAAVRAEWVRFATDWPATHLRTYGLPEWAPPPEGGGWGGHYICPDDGANLEYSPGHNRCPRCQREYRGWPTDYVIYTRRHLENAHAARDLGLAYRLTGEATFAAKARRVLLAYARLYPTLPIRSHKDWPAEGHRSGGRVTSQTLNESDWVHDMAWGYELIRATLAPEERTQIERDVLRSAHDVIARRERGLGNWTARHNAAHLAVGLVLRDRALVALALDREYGWRDQLRRGVTDEGVWHERSWGYHFYALEALLRTREMAARAGLLAPEEERLARLLVAPLAMVLPDGRLPNFNDSHGPELRQYAWYYDYGYKAWGDPRFLHGLRGAERTWPAVLWGAPTAETGAAPPLPSTVLPEAGFATLRTAGSDHVVAVKFGPHGGGHGHYDKLNFVSYAGGRMQAVDPGTQSYAFKTHHTWDKVTLAHNTIVVDEASQREAAGRLLAWHPGAEATAVWVDAGAAYAQARLRRLLVHTADYLLDVAVAESRDGVPHRYDWAYHQAGRTVTTPLAVQPYGALPTTEGYQYLGGPRAAVTAEAWTAAFPAAGGGGAAARLWALGGEETTVVLAEGLGQDLTVPVPCVLARRRGYATRFVSVLEPPPGRVRVVREGGPGEVVVETAQYRDTIGIAPGRYRFTRERRVAADSSVAGREGPAVGSRPEAGPGPKTPAGGEAALPGAVLREDTPPRIFLLGGSTLATFAPGAAKPGWGQMFPRFWREPAMVRNHGSSGRSSKSFIAEGRWAAVERELAVGDYVIIHFGTNDAKRSDPTKFTEPRGEFRANLERIVRETRAKGAVPLLATALARRAWDEKGNYVDDRSEYVVVTREVAVAQQVPLLEMRGRSLELERGAGPEGSVRLHAHYAPGRHPDYPAGLQDNTHYSPEGARRIAALVVEELRRLELPVVRWLATAEEAEAEWR